MKLKLAILFLLLLSEIQARTSRSGGSGSGSRSHSRSSHHSSYYSGNRFDDIIINGKILLKSIAKYVKKPAEYKAGKNKIIPVPATAQEKEQLIAKALATHPLDGDFMYEKCYRGHTLVHSDDPSGRGEKQVCNVCGKRYNGKAGSWKCKECDFDVCETCRVFKMKRLTKEKLRFPACGQKHPLVPSRYRGEVPAEDAYADGKYQCAACFQIKNCEVGRHFCPYCLVDVCHDCQQEVTKDGETTK